MNAEIIGIGSELLLGQIVNTDAQFLSQQLSYIRYRCILAYCSGR
jgi:nicotinamide-nucleotide amidase